MKPVTQSIKKSHILYEGALLDHADEGLFAPAITETAAAGRGTTLFFTHGTLQLVLRHYRRGGLLARLLGDRYLWTGVARSRPWREWQLLSALHARGLPVPRPIAARAVRHGIFYSADLITERLRAEPLSVRLRRGALALSAWHAVGACIGRFHAAGVYHADLNAHNIMLTGQAEVFLIDFDRGALRGPGAWRQANLNRLHRSLVKLRTQWADFAFDSAAWDALLAGYADADGANAQHASSAST